MLKYNWQTEERDADIVEKVGQTEERDADIVEKVDEEDRGRHKSQGWRELQHPAHSHHQR